VYLVYMLGSACDISLALFSVYLLVFSILLLLLPVKDSFELLDADCNGTAEWPRRCASGNGG